MNKLKTVKNKQIAIYKDSKGNIDFRIDADKETLWATQAQIADVFSIDDLLLQSISRTSLKTKKLLKKVMCKKCTLQNQINLFKYIHWI